MRALVVYESMFGSTRIVAEAIAATLDRGGMTTTLTTAASAPGSTAGFDLVVVGASTHGGAHPPPDLVAERSSSMGGRPSEGAHLGIVCSGSRCPGVAQES